MEFAFFVEFEVGVGFIFDMVDEEDAVEVVDLVLENAGETVGGLNADLGAVFEEGFETGFGVAGDKTVDVRNGEAAFVIGGFFAFVFDDFGVDEGDEIGVFLFVHVFADDDNALVVAQLRGGESGGEFEFVGFFPVEGGLAHFGDNVEDFRGDLADFGGFFAEFGVGGGDDFHWGYCSMS